MVHPSLRWWFAGGSSEAAVGFFGLLDSLAEKLSQLHLHVLLVPYSFSVFYLLKGRVPMQALQHCGKGSQACLPGTGNCFEGSFEIRWRVGKKSMFGSLGG